MPTLKESCREAAPFQLSYIERLRVIAILAVIGLHASAVRVVGLQDLHSASWWTAHIADSLCRWAVPVFIMISGALLLGRDYNLTEFYRKRMVRVGVPLLIWASFYFYWTAAVYGEKVDWPFIKKALWSGLLYNHLYFLFIIIGLYAVTPLLRVAAKFFPPVFQWITIVLIFAMTMSGALYQYVTMNALTRFIPYISFFMLGHLLHRRTRPLAPGYVWLGCFAAATAWIVIKTYFLIEQYGRDDYRAFAFYDHFTWGVLIQSVSMFLFLKSLPPSPEGIGQKAVSFFAKASFGIYLIHVIFMDLIRQHTLPYEARWLPFILPLEVMTIFLFSGLTASIALRIPLLRLAVGAG